MLINGNRGGFGVDFTAKPQTYYTGKWSGWHIEMYDGVPYWEALFSESGTLTAVVPYVCDAWGIGGGGSGGGYYSSGHTYGNGAGSGFTNMVSGLTIPQGNTSITIGAGATAQGATGGATKFLTLTCEGGNGGSTTTSAAGTGGSNGGAYKTSGGSNGTPGAGKIMSKFWSIEHNTEYGAGGATNSEHENGGGGGGYLDVGAHRSTSGHGYGAGGGGARSVFEGVMNDVFYDWQGKSGCLIIRIKAE